MTRFYTSRGGGTDPRRSVRAVTDQVQTSFPGRHGPGQAVLHTGTYQPHQRRPQPVTDRPVSLRIDVGRYQLEQADAD